MSESREELEQKISDLKKKIEDAKNRLPAHTIRPHQLQDIEDMEDELEVLKSRSAGIKE